MSNRLLAALLVPVLSPVALAQYATVTVQALTQQTTLVGSPTQTWPVNLPAGPLPSTGQLGGGQIQLGAPRTTTVYWSSSVTTTGVTYRLRLLASQGPAGSYATLGQSEMLVTIAGTGGTAFPWRLEGGLTHPAPNMPGQLFLVDVGNTGAIDWTVNSGHIGAFGQDLTAQPLQVRVVYNAFQYGTGAADATLELRVVPGDVDAFRIASNCVDPFAYSVDPLIGAGADVLISTTAGTAWQVLGFSTSPVVLPLVLTSTPVPCLLLPSPDWVHLSPNVFVNIPMAVRPISFYAQSIDLWAGDLRLSDTFLVTAN